MKKTEAIPMTESGLVEMADDALEQAWWYADMAKARFAQTDTAADAAAVSMAYSALAQAANAQIERAHVREQPLAQCADCLAWFADWTMPIHKTVCRRKPADADEEDACGDCDKRGVELVGGYCSDCMQWNLNDAVVGAVLGAKTAALDHTPSRPRN